MEDPKRPKRLRSLYKGPLEGKRPFPIPYEVAYDMSDLYYLCKKTLSKNPPKSVDFKDFSNVLTHFDDILF